MKTRTKLISCVLVLIAVVTFNEVVVSGPLAEDNTEAALKQFDGKPAAARGFRVRGYTVPLAAFYMVEVAFLAAAFASLFRKDIYRLKKPGSLRDV